MTPCTLALLCLATTAPERITLHPAPPGEAHFATVEVENRFGLYTATVTLPTIHGPVEVHYVTTIASIPGDPDSADRACVTSAPANVIALPQCLDVLEGETGEIRLIWYVGG
jgi:hypothetical protein